MGGSISVLCHSVPFDANSESQSQKCSNSRENVVYLVFFLCCQLLQQQTSTAEIRGRGDIVTAKSRQAKKHNQMTNHLFCSGERNKTEKKNEGM